MKLRLLRLMLLWGCFTNESLAQTPNFTFPVDTLVKTGTLTKRINVCLLPEGYQASEMAKFQTDAQAFVSALLNTTPFVQ